MSLRNQINLRILLISILTLLLGGTMAIMQARTAVEQEVDSSLNLAVQLIRLSMPEFSSSDIDQNEWLRRLSTMEQTRHLSIHLEMTNGEVIHLNQNKANVSEHDLPPSWFVHLVGKQYPVVKQSFKTSNEQAITLLLKADPMDEMIEVWEESLAYFVSLCVLVFLSFVAIHLVFSKTLKVIHDIVTHLKAVEKGDYQTQLPMFATEEYDNIAKAINHMTQVLQQTREQNRSLTRHSLQIQEEERQRLSQELHDEFGQSLTAIKVMAVTAAHKNADTQQLTRSISEICDHLMAVVRSMMQQLHPLILSELGLKATLEDLVDQWKKRNSEILFQLDCVQEVEELPTTISIQVLRVIQESLTNIMRHSQADKVEISLHIVTHPNCHLQLHIQDNGLGCNVEGNTEGFGLLGMKERIATLGGELNYHSLPGEGMKIHATVPV